jgi:hypothetical protein
VAASYVASDFVPKRRLVPLLAAVAAVGLVSTGCADQSAAIRVGDESISEKDFLDEVDALGSNEAALQLIVGASPEDVAGALGDSSYQQRFVAFMADQRVYAMLLHQVADDAGIDVSVDDVQQVRTQVEGELESNDVDLAELPEAYLDRLAEDIAVAQALEDEMAPEDQAAAVLEQAEKTDIEVSSRLGEWNQDAFLASLGGSSQGVASVDPPEAPLPSPDAPAADDLGITGG